MPECLQIHIKNSVARITLDRPEVRNVLDAAMTECLLDSLEAVDHDASVRVLVLAANGACFCAGADLNWLYQTRTTDIQIIDQPAKRLAHLLKRMDQLSKPVIALVDGGVYGGGNGLVACADIVLATPQARFRFSEVRLGLIPAVISPYVIRAIGARAARRYLLTAELLSAQQALHVGLIHELADLQPLQRRLDSVCTELIEAGPQALARTKQLIDCIASHQLDGDSSTQTAVWLQEISDSEEAKEGIRAFLEKRPARWASIKRVI